MVKHSLCFPSLFSLIRNNVQSYINLLLVSAKVSNRHKRVKNQQKSLAYIDLHIYMRAIAGSDMLLFFLYDCSGIVCVGVPFLPRRRHSCFTNDHQHTVTTTGFECLRARQSLDEIELLPQFAAMVVCECNANITPTHMPQHTAGELSYMICELLCA